MLVTLISLSLGGSLQQSPLDGKLDYDCPATRAEAVLERLSEKTGLKLKASRAVSSDVLVIHVQGVSVRDLLVKIAAAAGAQWETKGDTTYLERARDVERHQREAVAKEYAGRLRPALQKMLNSEGYRQRWSSGVAQKLAADTEKAMNPSESALGGPVPGFEGLTGKGPASRLLTGLLAAIGPNQLAEHMADPRTVYATSPTDMQVVMQPAEGALDQFLQEETAFVAATKAYKASQSASQLQFKISGVDEGDLQAGDLSKGIGQVLLRVDGSYWSDEANSALTVADGANKVLADGFATISLEPRSLKKFESAGDDSAIPVDNLTAEFKAETRPNNTISLASSVIGTGSGLTFVAYAATGSGMQTVELGVTEPVRSSPISPALLNWLSAPATNEPLRLSAGSLLTTTALRRSDNLVADLDDRCFNEALQLCDGKTTPSKWLSSDALQRFNDVSEESGWLVVSPRDIADARKNRINRAGLQELIAFMRKRNILTLDVLGRYAQSQYARPEGGSFDYRYMQAINPTATSRSFQPGNWEMCTVFGALDPQQREGLRGGGTLDLSSLNENAREAVRRMIFDAGSHGPILTDRYGKQIEPYSQGIIQDWTQLLPGGIPPPTGLNAKVETGPAAYCVSSAEHVAQIMSLADIAREQYFSQSADLKQFASPLHFDKFVPATETKYHFRFQFAPGIGTEADLTDADFDDSVEARPMAEMPNSYLDAISKAVAELQNSVGKINLVFGGNAGTAQP